MKIQKIRVIPRFMSVGEQTAITGHFGIVDKRSENKRILAVLSTDNTYEFDDFITVELDVSDDAEFNIMDKSTWKDIMETIEAVSEHDLLTKYLSEDNIPVYIACCSEAFGELRPLIDPPSPTPVEEESAAEPEAIENDEDRKLYFPMVNGNIYDIDMRNINWEDTVSHARDVAAKQQSFRAIVYNLFKADSTEEERNQMIDNAGTIINDAFTALGMDIKYDNMDSGDDPRTMLLLKLFDLNTIYSEFMTHIHMYALRNDFAVTMQRIAENYMDLYKTIEQPEETEDPVAETGDPVAEMIDEVADTEEE